jgi:hypothetical protein
VCEYFVRDRGKQSTLSVTPNCLPPSKVCCALEQQAPRQQAVGCCFALAASADSFTSTFALPKRKQPVLAANKNNKRGFMRLPAHSGAHTEGLHTRVHVGRL